MTSLKTHLTKTLAGAERIALLAVGSTLRGDDDAGILVARHLRQMGYSDLAAKPASSCPPATPVSSANCRLAIFIGQTTPENLTGQIKAFKPSHLVIVDAADMGQPPGHVAIIDPNAVGGGSFSTHALPLPVLIDYLRQDMPCQAIIIGIQPASREFGTAPCPQVLRAAKELAQMIAQVVEAG